jgi:hypothetical protein
VDPVGWAGIDDHRTDRSGAVGGVVGTSVALTLPLGSSPGVTLDVLSGVVCGMIAAPTAIGFLNASVAHDVTLTKGA